MIFPSRRSSNKIVQGYPKKGDGVFSIKITAKMVKGKKEEGINWYQKETGKTQQPCAHADSYNISAQNTLKRQY